MGFVTPKILQALLGERQKDNVWEMILFISIQEALNGFAGNVSEISDTKLSFA